jgi:hypothetical protein
MLALMAGAAQAQPAMNEQAKNVVGTWEFSNADRDKTCSVTLKAEPAPGGYKAEFDPNCAAQFPLTGNVVSWKYPDNDLLYLLDARGQALVQFSEVEDSIFEAPTPGVGVLFLQNPAAAPAPAKSAAQVAGNWMLKRGDGAVLCQLVLTETVLKDGFALKLEPGCEASVARLGFTQWRLDREELLLVPARGAPWRFESIDEKTWGQLPESDNRVTLVRR